MAAEAAAAEAVREVVITGRKRDLLERRMGGGVSDGNGSLSRDGSTDGGNGADGGAAAAGTTAAAAATAAVTAAAASKVLTPEGIDSFLAKIHKPGH